MQIWGSFVILAGVKPWGAIILFLGAVFLVSSPVWADIYAFTDSDGVVHFAQKKVDARYKLLFKTAEEKKTIIAGRESAYVDWINKYSQKYGVDPLLITAIIRAESNFNPKATSEKGAQGLMQLMPMTADFLKVEDSYNSEANIQGGVRYFRYLLDRMNGNVELALASYNAGPNAVAWYGGIPPYDETQNYVKKVIKYWRDYQKKMGVKPADLAAPVIRSQPIYTYIDRDGVYHFTNVPSFK